MILGIDPGLNGAVCAVSDNGKYWVCDMPTLSLRRGKTERREIDLARLRDMIEEMIWEQEDVAAFVERAQAMPKQGTASMFSFGQSYGAVLGILAALQVPVTIVAPAKWKRALGVPKGKDGARARASALLPHSTHYWPLRKHDGRAEAALIALYGQRSG